MLRRTLAVLSAASLLALAGCGGSDLTPGMLEVRLVDAPSPTASSFLVTIDRLDVLVGAEWQTIALPGKRLDLLALRDIPVPIANTGLTSGSFAKLRMKVKDAQVVDQNGLHSVEIPQAILNGFEIPCEFDVMEGSRTRVLLDFNVTQSLVFQNGKYTLQPVVPAVDESMAGTLSGRVLSPFGFPLGGAKVSVRSVAGPNYLPGFEINTAMTEPDGSFKVWALLEGEFEFRVTWQDPFTNQQYSAEIPSVVVTAQQDTPLGDVTAS